MPHLGRHPNKYHEFVLRNMRKASDLAQGNVDDFIKYFNIHVKKPIIQNVELLRKSGWK